MADIRCRRFSDILRTKEDHYPYSDRYISEVHDSSTKTGRTEREHMVEWFRANETKGSGIDELTVKIAYEAAVGAGDYRRACGAIRKTITWDMVYACV